MATRGPEGGVEFVPRAKASVGAARKVAVPLQGDQPWPGGRNFRPLDPSLTRFRSTKTHGLRILRPSAGPDEAESQP